MSKPLSLQTGLQFWVQIKFPDIQVQLPELLLDDDVVVEAAPQVKEVEQLFPAPF